MRAVLLHVKAQLSAKAQHLEPQEQQRLFCEWLEQAGLSSAEVVAWTTGDIQAESWAFVHSHFTAVAEQNRQLEKEVAELKARLQPDKQQQPAAQPTEVKHNE